MTERSGEQIRNRIQIVHKQFRRTRVPQVLISDGESQTGRGRTEKINKHVLCPKFLVIDIGCFPLADFGTAMS